MTKQTFPEFKPNYTLQGRDMCGPCAGSGWVAPKQHPDPENAVATCLAELDELYRLHWHNVYERRNADDLAKACDEVTRWVRQVKENAYGPTERINEQQYGVW